jgi:uncharacterized protein (TIGR00369 family)
MIDETVKQKILTAFKEVPYLQLLGMELLELDEGRAVVKLEMKDHHRQPYGVLHGGATASVIDTATAFAIISALPAEKATTVDLTVHYLRPVSTGFIICEAKIVRAGKRLITVSADVHDNQGKQIATALSTYTKL